MKKRVFSTQHRLYALLEAEASKRNHPLELSQQKPDPLFIASRYKDEYCALVCALFAYGNAKAIISFLETLPFSLLDEGEETIAKALSKQYYRFQSIEDVQAFFIALSKLKKLTSLEACFMQAYFPSHDVIKGIHAMMHAVYETHPYRSKGYSFLIGSISSKEYTSTYKRWLLFLRWMVRKDHLDLGLWQGVRTQDLLIPLDVHTFRLGRKLGLIQRKSYDFKAVLEMTEALKCFDFDDPIKYDFALYRIGQEQMSV